MQIGSAPSTRRNSRTQVRFYGVRFDARGEGPHAAAVVLGAAPGSLTVPSGTTALFVVTAADGSTRNPG
jgi:hypothetical protein